MSNYFKIEFSDKIEMFPEVEQRLYTNLSECPKHLDVGS